MGKFKVDDSGVVSANPSTPAVNSGAHGDGARFDRRLGAQRTCPAPGRAGPAIAYAWLGYHRSPPLRCPSSTDSLSAATSSKPAPTHTDSPEAGATEDDTT